MDTSSKSITGKTYFKSNGLRSNPTKHVEKHGKVLKKILEMDRIFRN